jgi:hypothetical protein
MVSRFSKNLLPMIRIAISQATFEAIARTLALGSVAVENEANATGLLFSFDAVSKITGIAVGDHGWVTDRKGA